MASILTTTKKVLGLEEAYTAFDLDVTTHINAAFATLNHLGVGPEDGFFIEDDTEQWEDIGLPNRQLHLVKSFIYLKVRMLFDPPGTSYLINAMDDQIKEMTWRLNMMREEALPPVIVEEVII